MSNYPIPNVAVVTGQEAGLDDRQYLRRLRELLQDVPSPADEQASGTGTALRYDLSIRPVNDDDYFQVIVDGTPQTVVQVPTPSPGQVYVDFDTGRLLFGSPPAVGTNNVIVYKNTVKWRDSTLLELLLEGARNMWPKLGRIVTDDTSIIIQTLVWDYPLPPPFNDPSVRLTQVAVRSIPAASERFHPIAAWDRIGNGILRIPPSQLWPPGSSVQLVYEAPYASLSQVEAKAQMLPLWFAGGSVMMFKEQKRTLLDTQNVTSEGQANPVGSQGNSGAALMRQFYTALSQMSRVRTSVQPTTVYDL
jgi:hypothetical protein